MIQNNLKEYISKQLKKGKKFEDIQKVLVQTGWSKQDVIDTYNDMKKDEAKPQKNNTAAIIGFIFAFLFWPAGLIVSIIGLNKYKKNPEIGGKGLAIAGIVISLLAPLLIVFITLFGLGLGFTRSMMREPVSDFQKISDNMEREMIDKMRENDQTLFLNQYDIKIEKGSEHKFFLGLNNNNEEGGEFHYSSQTGKIDVEGEAVGEWISGSGSVITCYDSIDKSVILSGTNDEDSDVFFETFEYRYVEPGETEVIPVIVKTKSTSHPTLYRCKAAIQDPKNPSEMYAEVDFTVTVQ